MSVKTHRRSRLRNRTAAAGLALLLGGGGLVAANVYASAGSSQGTAPRAAQPQDQAARGMSTIACPEVADALPEVPRQARREVSRNLAQLDAQVAFAYKKLRWSDRQIRQDPNYARNAILGPLENRRTAAIDRIAIAISRNAPRPSGLERLAGCELKENVPEPIAADPRNEEQNGGDRNGNGRDGGAPGQDGDQNNQDGNNQEGNGQNGNGQNGNNQNGNAQPGGPARSDFVDITRVRPNVPQQRIRNGASRGKFTTECGRNENGLFNPDNVIVAPGVSNGAHHMHDYVGNQGNDAFASDNDLARAQTTCVNQNDKSSYFWPVLRLQNGQNERDANEPGGGQDGNVGQIQTPSSVTLTFEGNPRQKVTAMPRFLRIITGDAKAFTNGVGNANASWSCTGFENRQLKNKYPICPEGSQVVRTLRFQSCWDGSNIDSANHRTHVDFTRRDGSCKRGFRAIPQMVQRITYDLPRGTTFAVDSFPEQLHKPITDHGDFINVMSDRLMKRVTNCINSGRNCKN
ncbi:DUF1996 domain-containing protein [Streptomyces durbertensis]|uniref:DUF1996 domain-containing protein n=1 Tax=Streptomyces durbertensis TaxID=2448886 RepID=A0ABR6EIQ4_9ACTN|nr:DUF1996 domain-containing protein [Streptomyces durbertensis]MBB1244952.1 DUF1996 domain-containing protein [Streptomyces durbertensis]